MLPTPSNNNTLAFRVGFATLPEALDYAAQGETGLNVYNAKGVITASLTWREISAKAHELAGRLLAYGFQPGDRIALLAESDADFVVGFFACQYAGLAPVPLPLPMPFAGKEGYLEHIRGMMQSSGAAAAFGPTELQEWLGLATEGLDLKLVGVMADLPEGSAPLPEIKPDDLAYLQFSSGSTRTPLGIAVTQKALMANALAQTRDGLKIRPGDRAVSWLPFYHDMGLVGFLVGPLASQISLDLIPTRAFARAPLLWLELISRNGGTVSYSPTFGFELCARRAETLNTDALDLSGWRIAGLGGDMIRPKVIQGFAERFARHGFSSSAFVASYGMAEATLALTMAPLGEGLRTDQVDTDLLEREERAAPPATADHPRVREFVLCGPALPEHEIEVRDEDGASLDERRVGRVFARGPSLMQTYFGRPVETAAVLSADGWLDTGDLGYLLNGQIVITGRAKDLMIVNGRNVWPQDLEWTAEAGVAGLRSGDVAVFSVDREAGEEIVALVQRKSADPVAREAIREEVARLLRVRHGLEVLVVATPPHSLPQTSSGKLSRTKAKALYLSGKFDQPADPREPALAQRG